MQTGKKNAEALWLEYTLHNQCFDIVDWALGRAFGQ